MSDADPAGLEADVAALVAELTGAPRDMVTPTSDLFRELGLDSTLLQFVATKVATRHGLAIDRTDVLLVETVKDLAAFLASCPRSAP